VGLDFRRVFIVPICRLGSRLSTFLLVTFMLAASLHAQTISTLAGGGPNNLAATASVIGSPASAVRDANGNTYISDSLSNRIFKVDTTGNLTVFAGNVLSNDLGDGGPATAASLSSPTGTAFDSAGNLYIADSGNDVIREVLAATGIIQTVAGNGHACSSACGDGGPATSAELNAPAGVWLDGQNNIYIADTGDYTVRVVNAQTGIINVVAGVEQTPCLAAPCGDGGPATMATLNDPQGVFVDSMGNIYIADTNDQVIRVVNVQTGPITVANVTIPAGDIMTVAGTIDSKCTTAPVCNDGSQATLALLYSPQGVFADSAGNIYIADTADNVIRKVNATGTANAGIINAIVGDYQPCVHLQNHCGDGASYSGINAQVSFPTAVLVDSTGNLYITDQSDNAIRVVNVQSTPLVVNGTTIQPGDIDTTAGELFDSEYLGDGGPAIQAALLRPVGVASDGSGNIFIADTYNSIIREVTSNGNIAAYAGTGDFPCSISPCGDGGLASAAKLLLPQDVDFDSAGNLYISDYHGQEGTAFPNGVSIVREVLASTGKIQAVAGSWSNGIGYSGDGALATLAQLNVPTSVAVDSSGDIFIADSANNVIREVVASTGFIQTVAGNYNNGTGGYSGDNGPATSAMLNNPTGVALDQAGNLYIADSLNQVIRVVNRQSIAVTIAGVSIQPGNIATIVGQPGTPCHTLLHCGDGGTALGANLDNPYHVLVDFNGDIFITDTGDYAIREVTPDGSNIQSVAGVTQDPGFAGDGDLATDPAVLLSSPQGLTSDPFGNVYFADNQAWRIREITKLADTAPTATLSTNTLAFPGQGVGTISSTDQSVTLSNNGNLAVLVINAAPAISGSDAGDFAIVANTCPAPQSGLAAGSSCKVTISFKPAAFGPRSATLTFNDSVGIQTVALSGIGENASTVLLSSSSLNDTSYVGEAVTLTATVAGTGGSPTGTVTFNDGTTALGAPVAINGSGIATLATSSLTAGNHSLTAFYSGDSNFAESTSSVLTQIVDPPNFILPSAISLSAGTVAPGKQLTATVTVAAGGSFTGTVTVACAITPASANAPTCALNPTSVMPTAGTPGTSTLTISTVAASSAQAATSRTGIFYSMWLILPAMFFSVAGASRKNRARLLGWIALAMVCGGLLLLGGCGGGGSSSGGGGSGGTTAGNYTVTVTATSGSLATQTSTATFTVQ
jgi:sugar lactone lactonase YvrE